MREIFLCSGLRSVLAAKALVVVGESPSDFPHGILTPLAGANGGFTRGSIFVLKTAKANRNNKWIVSVSTWPYFVTAIDYVVCCERGNELDQIFDLTLVRGRTLGCYFTLLPHWNGVHLVEILAFWRQSR